MTATSDSPPDVDIGDPAVGEDRPELAGPEPAEEFARLFDAYAVPLQRYLARRVYSHGGPPMLAYAADALRTGLLPSDVRSALYRALAKVPGLVIRDQAANLDGRIGIAYGMSWNTKQGRQEIIVDPHTGEFIGERTVMPADTLGVPGGTITSSTAVSTAVVDQIGTRPAR